jgi:hypothetical protein
MRGRKRRLRRVASGIAARSAGAALQGRRRRRQHRVDRKRIPVARLTADDFEIVEGAGPQTVRYFAAGQGAAGPPMHLVRR